MSQAKEVKQDRKYTKDHEWTLSEGAELLVGITAFAVDALARVKANGLTRTIVGFEMVGRGIARHGYPLLDSSGTTVGVCTSGGPSPTLGNSIGLGYLPIALSAVGTTFLVDCRGKSIDAKVVKPPFYKRKPSAGIA